MNQPPPLSGYNLFTSDAALMEALDRAGAGWAKDRATEFGALMGDEETQACGFQANENPPVLHSPEVEYHAAYHNLMRLSVEHGLHSLPWERAHEGAHAARAALLFLASQNECGHTCPISMTYASVPVLRRYASEWEPRILSRAYDARFLPAAQKTGATIGMAMTEKQGGSDVRANITRAEPISGGSGEYLLTGHKWFCSAPMSDAFLVLAQAPGGLSCFLLPRWTPDGALNQFHIQRLKNKLGNRSNASSEVEFTQAWAQRLGDEGRGVATIIEMVHHTRLDCVIASAALMRQATVQAVHHARHRVAFGSLLIEQPLMRNVLADLCVESEVATLLMMRLAQAFDAKKGPERGLARLGTAIAKYWICKRAPMHVNEALECLGGNGYVEASILPRLYREAPLLSIWEGSGNVICLDVLRAIAKEPESLESVLAEIHLARGADRRFDAILSGLERAAAPPDARRFTEDLALALQASLLLRFSTPEMFHAFAETRLANDWRHTFGTLPASVDAKQIIDRAWPSFPDAGTSPPTLAASNQTPAPRH